MVAIISLEELQILAGKKRIDIETIIKDFYLTYLLYLIKDVKGLYFKGGTALYKIFLNNLRLSEDLDFTVKGDLKDIEKQIKEIIKVEKIFKEIRYGKRTKYFVRLLVSYGSPYGNKDHIIIDLNKKAKIYLKTEEHELNTLSNQFKLI